MTGASLVLWAQQALATAASAAAEEAGVAETDAGAFTPAERVAENALFLVVDLGIVSIAAALGVCMWRVLRGPTLVDRGIASDIFAVQVVGLAVLLTIRLRTLLFFDAVLIVSILGFASTVAFAQFIGRRRAV